LFQAADLSREWLWLTMRVVGEVVDGVGVRTTVYGTDRHLSRALGRVRLGNGLVSSTPGFTHRNNVRLRPARPACSPVPSYTFSKSPMDSLQVKEERSSSPDSSAPPSVGSPIITSKRGSTGTRFEGDMGKPCPRSGCILPLSEVYCSLSVVSACKSSLGRGLVRRC
jgi:hypothetical protein